MTAMVIGLGGRLRAGKDVVADRLVDRHGFVKLGMSDALHEAMLALDPIVLVDEFVQYREGPPGYGWNTPRKQMRYAELCEAVGYVEAKKTPEVRRLLQHLGTEVGRNMIGENVWVNVMARKIDDYLYSDIPVVVTGIRFPNELSMIRAFAGRAVWVDRPGLGETTSSHASESGVQGSDFDLTLLNDSSLEHLRGLVDLIVPEVKDQHAELSLDRADQDPAVELKAEPPVV
jgi:hypothetical protein